MRVCVRIGRNESIKLGIEGRNGRKKGQVTLKDLARHTTHTNHLDTLLIRGSMLLSFGGIAHDGKTT